MRWVVAEQIALVVLDLLAYQGQVLVVLAVAQREQRHTLEMVEVLEVIWM
jgi:hypothetical protein